MSEPVRPGGPDVDAVAAAVLGVTGVRSLHGGVLDEVATYLPGRRVAGVRFADGRCDLHVVTTGERPLADTVRDVRRAVGALVAGPVDVTVEDVQP